jgi:hypothetical protein
MMPTTLHIYNFYDENRTNFERITYKMDLDDNCCIDIYRNMVKTGSFIGAAIADFAQFKDRKNSIHQPTDEDRENLYIELRRGATGLFTD